MKKPSTRMIALQLERKEASACQAFARASEQAEAKIIAAVEAIRPYREKLRQAKLERAAFVAGQVNAAADPAEPGPEAGRLSTNHALSALAHALNTRPSAALDKPRTGTERRTVNT